MAWDMPTGPRRGSWTMRADDPPAELALGHLADGRGPVRGGACRRARAVSTEGRDARGPVRQRAAAARPGPARRREDRRALRVAAGAGGQQAARSGVFLR